MDNLKFFLGIGLAVVIVFAGFSVYTSLQKSAGTPADRETLYQVSTIDALMQGAYEGVRPVGEIRKHGDFGIGTFDALDGEMIVLDGTVYQAKADGKIYPVQDSATTPFATVTWFDRDFSIAAERPMNSSEYSKFITSRLPTENLVYAVQVKETFPSVKVRAIPAQKKPYPVLTEAAKSQSVHEYRNITGTLVGFYTPVLFEGLNVPGYHLHFIADDHSTGGHVLDFSVAPGTDSVFDSTAGFAMELPTTGSFTGVNLSQDLSADLQKVEK